MARLRAIALRRYRMAWVQVASLPAQAAAPSGAERPRYGFRGDALDPGEATAYPEAGVSGLAALTAATHVAHGPDLGNLRKKTTGDDR